jgi:repressor LexA
MNMVLSKRQLAILEYLRSHQLTHGQPPSTREIQHHFRFKSQNSVMNHLRALARRDFIELLGGRVWAAKAVTPETSVPTSFLPILGSIPAGLPTDEEQIADKSVAIDVRALGFSSHVASQMFALVVRGDSMIDAHILDGDLALVVRRPARPGDIVAALIDGETTLKRLTAEGKRVYLKAENPRYADIHPVERLEVQGVYIGLLRTLHN